MTKPRVRYKLLRSTQKGRAPRALLVGELAANIGDDPPTVWVGTPGGPRRLDKLRVSVDELERLANLSFRHAVGAALDRVTRRAEEERAMPKPRAKPPRVVRC